MTAASTLHLGERERVAVLRRVGWARSAVDRVGAVASGAGVDAGGSLLGVGDKTWRDWEAGRRRMPAGMMELLCILMAVGTVEGGPYIAPGDWMRPWVRNELALWFRRPAPLAPPMCMR